MGDAILCTPALRAIRRHFKSSPISFFAKPVIREVLSPSSFNDIWLEQQNSNPFVITKMLKRHKFTHAILFKNSFASALAVLLAKIPSRIGYAREGRSPLLTDKLYPPKLPDGKFKPISMIDYYLAIASWLGADTAEKSRTLYRPTRRAETASQTAGSFQFQGAGYCYYPRRCIRAEQMLAQPQVCTNSRLADYKLQCNSCYFRGIQSS